MAAIQYVITAYDKLWDLLEAHAAFINNIRVGNRIDWTTGRAAVKKYGVQQKAPADYYEMELTPGAEEDTGFDLSPHYGMKTTAASIASLVWTEEIRHTFRLRLSTHDLRITTFFLQVAEAKTAIRKGGPRLGLTDVFKRGGMTSTDPMEEVDANGNTRVLSCEISIPVTWRFNGQSLIQ